MTELRRQPGFLPEHATSIVEQHFGIQGVASPLPSERDQNFRIDAGDQSFVLKIANPATSTRVLELENAALQIALGLDTFDAPELIRTRAGSPLVTIRDPAGDDCQVRMVSFLPGDVMARSSRLDGQTLMALGSALGDLDNGLAALNQHPAARRTLVWDLAQAEPIVEAALTASPNSKHRFDADQLQLLRYFLDLARPLATRIQSLPRGVIHNDANDYNVLIQSPAAPSAAPRIGLIDFGDMLFTSQIHELAIASAYAILGPTDTIMAIQQLAAGYHQQRPLSEDEISVLFPLAAMRLCQSVCLAAKQRLIQPDNEYLSITEQPAWQSLRYLATLDPVEVHAAISQGCHGSSGGNYSLASVDGLQTARNRYIASALSLSYEKPLHLVRGRGQYLFDSMDVTYLDCVNNVCHVGHCHPHVVEAAHRQMASLNTNTRYLHQNLVQYAQRLTATLPDPLQVCFFVNSGSEANDLALRLARTFTQRRDVVVLDHAYHGHTTALIEISPYKFASAGGNGRPPHVHVLPAPDEFRGPYRGPECGACYADQAVARIESFVRDGCPPAALFAESIMGCGGQLPLPPEYLPEVYRAVRSAGGICVADEVQVGFGRVGTHFWGFETLGVVPDIVTMGKPIGNGHPLAAVVTTAEIAAAFDNGMEYFNTFGGNPVSCAIGMAVLDVIEQEQLPAHALRVGQQLIAGLNRLQSQSVGIGDIRGSGLFLGIEMSIPDSDRQPDPARAKRIIEFMKSHRILLSLDGPDHNVIKFKPPMVFSEGDGERLTMTLRDALKAIPPDSKRQPQG